MKFSVLTLFPDIVNAFFTNSIMEKAVAKGIISYEIINIRDFAFDKHRSCDDSPYGGGAGMILKAEPLALALDSIGAAGKYTVFPTPSGKSYKQSDAESLAGKEELVIICGRYEGIDQRIIDEYVDDEFSIGDYVLSSGEVAALALIDSVYRLCDDVITRESLEEESFQDNLLEYPHYTRPEIFRDRKVPEILLSGNHRKIDEWRMEKRLEKTRLNRPDLLEKKE